MPLSQASRHGLLAAALAVSSMVLSAGVTSAHAQTVNPNAARYLAANCANCHGTDGKGLGAMPPLSGMDKTYFLQQMQQFKSGQRPATLMHQLSKGYTDEQIVMLADYFASQKLAK